MWLTDRQRVPDDFEVAVDGPHRVNNIRILSELTKVIQLIDRGRAAHIPDRRAELRQKPLVLAELFTPFQNRNVPRHIVPQHEPLTE